MFFSPLTKSKSSFEGQRPYETVRLLLYRHWFTLVPKMLAMMLAAAAPVLVVIFAGDFITSIGLASAFNFVIAVYCLLWWSGLFYIITMYLLDTWLVTDHRVLDNEQHGFFRRTLTEASLSKIQDTSVKVSGLIPTFLDYGDIEIQTAGTVPKITLKKIAHPNAVKVVIAELVASFASIHKDGVEIHEQKQVE